MSLVHQDLAIDEAESENKLAPLWPDSLRRVKNAKLGGKYSGLVPIREIPSSIGMHLHVVFSSSFFVRETNLPGSAALFAVRCCTFCKWWICAWDKLDSTVIAFLGCCQDCQCSPELITIIKLGGMCTEHAKSPFTVSICFQWLV